MKEGTVAKTTWHKKDGTVYTFLNGQGLCQNQMLFILK